MCRFHSLSLSLPFFTKQTNELCIFCWKGDTILRRDWSSLYLHSMATYSRKWAIPVACFFAGRMITHRTTPLFIILTPWLLSLKFWISGYGSPKAHSCRFLSLSLDCQFETNKQTLLVFVGRERILTHRTVLKFTRSTSSACAIFEAFWKCVWIWEQPSDGMGDITFAFFLLEDNPRDWASSYLPSIPTCSLYLSLSSGQTSVAQGRVGAINRECEMFHCGFWGFLAVWKWIWRHGNDEMWELNWL